MTWFCMGYWWMNGKKDEGVLLFFGWGEMWSRSERSVNSLYLLNNAITFQNDAINEKTTQFLSADATYDYTPLLRSL